MQYIGVVIYCASAQSCATTARDTSVFCYKTIAHLSSRVTCLKSKDHICVSMENTNAKEHDNATLTNAPTYMTTSAPVTQCRGGVAWAWANAVATLNGTTRNIKAPYPAHLLCMRFGEPNYLTRLMLFFAAKAFNDEGRGQWMTS